MIQPKNCLLGTTIEELRDYLVVLTQVVYLSDPHMNVIVFSLL